MLILIQNLNLLIDYCDQILNPSRTNLFSKQRGNQNLVAGVGFDHQFQHQNETCDLRW